MKHFKPKLTEELRLSREFFTKTRVIYAHTDQMGVVYYGNYASYFEIGRNEMLREIGLPYKELEALGIFLPVYEFKINYYAPALFDDELVICSTASQETNKKIRFKINCSISNATGKLLCGGYTVHLLMDSGGRPLLPKGKTKEAFAQIMSCLFPAEICQI